MSWLRCLLVESQNHFYGHSAAFAAYLGRSRPRHIPGLVQHGWAARSPISTHFRDFPNIGGRGGADRLRLLVWSHTSKAWDPAAETRCTTAVGAPFAYLVKVAGQPPEPRDDQEKVVLMPVHGIQTQRVRGDHRGLARSWREAEGPATVCLYAADAADPDIVAAYRQAGHRLVVLGERTDPAFLWRLWTLLGRADRVVSNRLSTPVLYAAHLGADVGVYGNAMRIDGEEIAENDRLRALWPDLHGQHVDPAVAAAVSGHELGVDHLLGPARLERVLGWHRPAGRAAVDYWTVSPAQRAVVNLRRRSTKPVTAPAGGVAMELGWTAWLHGALSYLPRRLPRSIPEAGASVEPLPVPQG